ncbi:glutathione S-transferase C-terminal domain-containing protein homolog [Macrosteles quadrilineatus]|uniref:glutathione S-transferase C-terminal domain-containing protein homolog n=1 Tax=Macrosteles quadrilineatus TaxID=74068 RepID=UPI0023E30201|nr:glutathione S-transferase C-terminal domain-containing protein homolog [Macrosteles quadrilineatus]
MPEVFLEVCELIGDEAEVPVESAVCLFLLQYLQHPPDVAVTLVLTERTDQPSLSVSVGQSVRSVTPDTLQCPVSDCCLPVFTAGGDNCVAGLCGVLRQVVKHSGEEWRHLLGFREGCLFACAEVSLWTKFCEIDIVQVVKDILKTDFAGEFKIPVHLARFEEHLKQPVRMHNLGKVKVQTENNRDVEHKFAEGPTMSLADLIVLPCVYIVYQTMSGLQFSEYLPSVVKWYELVINDPLVVKGLSCLKIRTRYTLLSFILPEVPQQSLYKSDPKRYKPKLRQFTRQEDVEEALRSIDGIDLDFDCDSSPFGHEIEFDWTKTMIDIQPDVPHNRLARKLQQLENLAKAVIKVAKPGDKIVDFCCGSGHLGVVLAYCLPQCHVVLLDNKEQSLDRAKAKVHSLGLTNLTFIQSNLDYFKGPFQIGASLHACGVASDLVIETSLQRKAAFVVCPCCYGSLQSNHVVSYPRSSVLSALPLRQYLVLGHCADQTHKQTYAKSEQGERCMQLIDSDRCLLARESGYRVSLAKLIPSTCSPKNNLLVGIPETASVS